MKSNFEPKIISLKNPNLQDRRVLGFWVGHWWSRLPCRSIGWFFALHSPRKLGRASPYRQLFLLCLPFPIFSRCFSIAFHSVSGRFLSFTLKCYWNRPKFQILYDEKQGWSALRVAHFSVQFFLMLSRYLSKKQTEQSVFISEWGKWISVICGQIFECQRWPFWSKCGPNS